MSNNGGKGGIIKLLGEVCYAGRKMYAVTEDWLDIVQASLQMMPAHVLAYSSTGKPAGDPPEITALWARLNQTYSRDDWSRFKDAFHLLIDVADMRAKEWHYAQNLDVLGEIYMETNISSNHSGQYFTPWEVARMMATQTVGDMDTVVAALDGHTAVNPLTVCDPCCGSGIMLLAAAICFPRDAVYGRRVQFFGQDADMTCVKMARINCMLYGLNGWGRMWDSAATVLMTIGGRDGLESADIELPTGQLGLFGGQSTIQL